MPKRKRAIETSYEDESLDIDTTCTICDAEFLDSEDLKIHILQVHSLGSNLVTCSFCPLSFKDEEKYALHIRDIHVINLRCCQYCSRVFVEEDKLRSHELRHYTNKKSLHSCSQCKFKFKNVIDLERHEFEVHTDSIDGVMLHKIYPLLSSVLNMKAPTFLQSRDTNTLLVCCYCQLFTSNVKEYVDHLKIKNCRSCVCNTCSNVYRERRGLYKHFKLHKECINFTEENTDKILCEICCQCFEPKAFNEHKNECGNIKCKSCNIVFDTMYELSQHHNQEHPLAVSLEQCMYCHREFVGKIAMKRHFERQHKKELHLYKYMCRTCEEVFKHPKGLFHHYFTKHRDLEPYHCRICDKKFRIRKRFTLHIKLEHKSVGFVEFNNNFHVFFTEKKSVKPFIPKAKLNQSIEVEKQELNLDTDFLDPTETEGNQTESENVRKVKRKRRTRATKSKKLKKDIRYSDGDDEPLIRLKEKGLRLPSLNNRKRKVVKKVNHVKFTCKICKKYCYTYQNYNHHLAMHSNKEMKRCIKCSMTFKSKEKLMEHINSEHSTSRLTETLKSLLEKRKKTSVQELSMSQRFRNTIKRVDIDYSIPPAILKYVPNKLSVQKFIENFTPENENKKSIQVESGVTMKIIKNAVPGEPKIKFTHFQHKTYDYPPKLSMPVRFQDTHQTECNVTIKLVQTANTIKMNFDTIEQEYYEDVDSRNDIPEVAQEVMLEESEDVKEEKRPSPIFSNILVSNYPKDLKNVHVAHLQPKAPYYKIVKIEDVLKKEEVKPVQPDNVKLPDGTKLVTVNPLAHLLKDVKLENVLPKNHYRTKTHSFENALAKALMKAERPSDRKKTTRKKTGPRVES